MYTASEVLELIEDEKLLDNDVDDIVSALDLDAESEDGDCPEGDGVDSEGSTVLLQNKNLNPEAVVLFAEGTGDLSPAERDSLLFSDSENENEDSSNEDGK